MKPKECPYCHVEYEQRENRDGTPLSSPLADMAGHMRWCQCWLCERFRDPGADRHGNCPGGPLGCTRRVPDAERLREAAAREADHALYNRGRRSDDD